VRSLIPLAIPAAPLLVICVATSIFPIDSDNNSYYDSLGQEIDYTLLSSQPERDKIKTLRIRIKCESADMIDDNYEAVEWEKTIKPKNI
jgi:hypothetical protein